MLNSILYKKIKLTDDIVKKFEVIRAFKYKHTLTKNLAWSYDGELLLTSNGNDSLTVYSLVKGNSLKTLHSKNCGVDVIRFLNNSNDMIVCSTKSNNLEHKQFLRFWDIKENKYLKSLPQIGNICELNGICVNQNKKLMLVNSDDGHIKLYYMNCDSPLILYKSNFMRPVSSFDNEGVIFAASFGKQEIHFYDLLMYDSGEYNIFNLKNNMNKEEFITNLLFTPNNKSIIVSTNENKHFRIDSITGCYICSYNYPTYSENNNFYDISSNLIEEKKNSSNSIINFCDQLNDSDNNNLSCHFENSKNDFFLPTITPDGKYIMCGWKDSGIHIWNENGNYITSLYGHEGPPKNVSFNPKCSILASSCLNIALWQPSM
ncbi:microtubule associated katanin, putative [Plasmodium relictum]|uniref:Microtubule associated katanin, putative n=1 Tax=Plasmodium relictum TaxID=85471 RepID=A0A1J1HC26_PLARL|nr:microtubule associated katanin, putative [Plasmodium relictum]CRH02855.1 microtubule associated katanin, putative [Plasmodium relictum]